MFVVVLPLLLPASAAAWPAAVLLQTAPPENSSGRLPGSDWDITLG